MKKLTKHAQKRQQQRCIPDLMIKTVSILGTKVPAGDGCTIKFFDKKSRKRIKKEFGAEPAKDLLAKWGNIFLVENPDGDIVTVGHRTKRIRRQ